MDNTEHIGDCDHCGTKGVYIAGGWSTRADKRCGRCEFMRKKKKVVLAPKWTSAFSTSTDRQIEKLGKDETLNNELWLSRAHVCDNCNRTLAVSPPPKHYFSHLLSKGAHPELRHVPENIAFHCLPCHQKWEFGDRKSMATYTKHIAYMVENGYVPTT